MTLNEPVHGWVPVRAEFGRIALEFEASDVPNNPIESLVDALYAVCAGREAVVWWHLEPDGYYFKFYPAQELVTLRVLFSENSLETRSREVHAIEGTRQEVLLPIWRALRAFQSFSLSEPHWPPVRFGQLEDLKKPLTDGPGELTIAGSGTR